MKDRVLIVENLSDYAKRGYLSMFWRYSFGSICSKNHRKALVYDQSVVKNVVNFLRSNNCFGIDAIAKAASFPENAGQL